MRNREDTQPSTEHAHLKKHSIRHGLTSFDHLTPVMPL